MTNRLDQYAPSDNKADTPLSRLKAENPALQSWLHGLDSIPVQTGTHLDRSDYLAEREAADTTAILSQLNTEEGRLLRQYLHLGDPPPDRGGSQKTPR